MSIFKRKRRRKIPFVISFGIILLFFGVMVADYMGYSLYSLFSPHYQAPEGQIRVHIIDVGQADCVLVETPDGCLLIDSGMNSSEDHLEEYLEELHIEKIDYFIITHAHSDHIGGADMLFEEFCVENVFYDNHKYSEKQAEMLIESGAKLYDVGARDVYNIGGLSLTILSADIEEVEDENDYSVVFKLQYGESSFVFTGDATEYAESVILERFGEDELDCDFIKAGHHGSAISSSEDFLRALTPDIVAISCGRGNSYGHPTKEALDRYNEVGAAIYRTDLMGDLIFVCDGTNITFIEE